MLFYLVTKSCLTFLWPHGLYVAHQAPLSLWFPRQEYLSGLPFPSPGYLLNPGTEPASASLADRLFNHWTTWKSKMCTCMLSRFSHVQFCNLMDYSLPGSSAHGILQARILKWVVMPSSRGFSQPRDWTQVSCIAGGFFTIWVTREAPIICWDNVLALYI